MKSNELVWLAVADAALSGQVAWDSVDDIAHAARTPLSTTHLALKKLDAIGAIDRRPRGGVIATNVEKILTVLAAWRNLEADTIARTTVDAFDQLADSLGEQWQLGGTDAARLHLERLTGRGDIASPGTRIVYVPNRSELPNLPPGNEVIVLEQPQRQRREWHVGFTSLAQTYADLFALPGWQADEYRRALRDHFLSHEALAAR